MFSPRYCMSRQFVLDKGTRSDKPSAAKRVCTVIVVEATVTATADISVVENRWWSMIVVVVVVKVILAGGYIRVFLVRYHHFHGCVTVGC